MDGKYAPPRIALAGNARARKRVKELVPFPPQRVFFRVDDKGGRKFGNIVLRRGVEVGGGRQDFGFGHVRHRFKKALNLLEFAVVCRTNIVGTADIDHGNELHAIGYPEIFFCLRIPHNAAEE